MAASSFFVMFATSTYAPTLNNRSINVDCLLRRRDEGANPNFERGVGRSYAAVRARQADDCFCPHCPVGEESARFVVA
mgnify:CR=1 FL=1